MKGVSQPSYAVDGDMDPSSGRYHYTCQPRFGDLLKIFGHCLATKEAIAHWLRLQTHMEWFPHTLQTYEKCFTTFICCGWGYGSIIWPLPLPLYLSAQIWSSGVKICGHCLATKEAIAHWLRLQTHMDRFPHLLQTYEKCFTTVICF